MKLSQRVRLVVLSFAVMSVAGVMAVLACGPLAPTAPPNGAGNVSDSVSAPATEAPFVLPQSGDGGGGQVEPTEVPTETPTPTATVPLDGDIRVGYRLRQYYGVAIEENTAREARGEAREFRVLPVFVKTTPDGEAAVAKFLEANGGLNVFRDPDASVGQIALDMDIGIIPELLDVEGFVRVDLDIDLAYRIPPYKKLRDPDGGTVSKDLKDRYLAALGARRTYLGPGGLAPLSDLLTYVGVDGIDFPVVRVSMLLWRADHVDYVVEFLEANGGENIRWTKDTKSKLTVGPSRRT